MSRRRDVIALLLAAAAVLLMTTRAAVGFRQEGVAVLVGLVTGSAIVGLMLILVPRSYHRAVDRMAPSAPGAWVRPCVDPAQPRSWRAIAIDEAGIRILGRRGTARGPWMYVDIAGADVRPIHVGLVQHPGVCLTLRTGETVEFLLPKRSTLGYPVGLARECVEQIRQRAGAGAA